MTKILHPPCYTFDIVMVYFVDPWQWLKMAAKTENASLIIIAIDFGTSFSGYAFSFADSNDVFLNTNWSPGSSSSYKTPTSVLTERKFKSHKFWKFGFEAHETYSNEISKKTSLCLFEEFKMELHQKSRVS